MNLLRLITIIRNSPLADPSLTPYSPLVDPYTTQVNGRHGIELLKDDNAVLFSSIMKCYGMQCVGWIFTDLLADNSGKGTVQHVRGNVVSL